MFHWNIRTKLLIVFMSLFTVALAVIFYWFYQFSTTRAMNALRQSLINSATISANLVDPVELMQVYQTGAEDDIQYTEIANQLRMVRDSYPNIADIYTLVHSPTNPKEVLFVVSADENHEIRAGLREAYDASNYPAMLAAFDGPTADARIGTDKFGSWLSGYAPIINASGQSVAIVGVDIDAADVLTVQAQIRSASLLAFVVAFVAVLGVSFLLADAITKSLRAITGAARLLEDGEPFEPQQLEKVARSSDEVGNLAKVFSRMAIQIQAREQKLKEEVSKLKIEIDEVKRARQVEEITDSDFFKDLKNKAKTMRGRPNE